MDRRHTAVLRFAYDDAETASRVERSVRVEVGAIDDARSSATVAREGRTVAVEIAAADLVALRAGLNTWSRLVDVAETVGAAG